MNRIASKTLQILLDLSGLAAAFGLAVFLRFDWAVPPSMMRRGVALLPYVVTLQYAALHVFRVPRFTWRYVGLREVVRILQALSAATALLLLVRLAAGELGGRIPFLYEVFVPMGIIAIDFVLAFCAIVGLRSVRRVMAERAGKAELQEHDGERVRAVPTILVGAGHEGLLVAKEIEARPDLGMYPVGFIDDDSFKKDSILHGVSVVGTTSDLVVRCRELGAEQVLITMTDAPGREIRRIVKLAEAAGLPTKIIPGLHELVGGQLNLSRLRSVAIEDLLRREQVKLDEQAIAVDARGKVLLVTGAGGSIGSELCRQLCAFEPKQLVLLERCENALFEIHRELRGRFPALDIVPTIADISDRTRMTEVLRHHRPHMVLHAAAHKHVPMMEWNPGEAVKNNVFGTKLVAELASEHGVSRFVLISTDKAVNPTSVMGATKRVAELILQGLSETSDTHFCAVRFGNVLGSAGSVVPIFKQQIASGGPVCVTHPEMRRYFMTIPEASQLVIQAATMGKDGEIFILDMGEPVYIADLAEDLIRLSGLRPGDDIEVQFTGLRPGEKLFEELSVESEAAEKTYHPKIFVGRIARRSQKELGLQLAALADAAQTGEFALIKAALQAIVPEFGEAARASDRPVPDRQVGIRSLEPTTT